MGLELAHRLTADLAATPVRPNPERILLGAARVVRNTPWANYRAGRQRLAGTVAVYFKWMAPPVTWQFASIPGDDYPALAWVAPHGPVIIDELAPSGSDGLIDGRVRERLERHLATGIDRYGDTFAGVRILATTMPLASLFVDRNGRRELLANTDFHLGIEID